MQNFDAVLWSTQNKQKILEQYQNGEFEMTVILHPRALLVLYAPTR